MRPKSKEWLHRIDKLDVKIKPWIASLVTKKEREMSEADDKLMVKRFGCLMKKAK